MPTMLACSGPLVAALVSYAITITVIGVLFISAMRRALRRPYKE